jgi:predicted transcriptional regulator
MPDRVALLSVRPRFAAALVDGSKTVEIRRRRVNVVVGTICLVYASSPMCALVGAVAVESTDVDEPTALWRRWGRHTGLRRGEYDSYLNGSVRACAIVISGAVCFPHPVSLRELRRRQGTFVTPQSYRFLADGELSSLLNGEAMQLYDLPDAIQSSALATRSAGSTGGRPPPPALCANRDA